MEGVRSVRWVVLGSAHDECESLVSTGFSLPPMDGTWTSCDTQSAVRWKRAAATHVGASTSEIKKVTEGQSTNRQKTPPAGAPVARSSSHCCLTCGSGAHDRGCFAILPGGQPDDDGPAVRVPKFRRRR